MKVDAEASASSVQSAGPAAGEPLAGGQAVGEAADPEPVAAEPLAGGQAEGGGGGQEPLAEGVPELLPPGTPKIIIGTPAEMPPGGVAQLGQTHAAEVDWVAIASHIGFPHLAPAFQDVFLNTKWRRSPNKVRLGVTQFTANKSEGSGTVGPMGADLVLATINLVAQGRHNSVQRLSAHPAA